MIGHHGHQILTPADLSVGQEVRVFSEYITRTTPDGRPGWVARVGRKLVTIAAAPNAMHSMPVEFRIVEQCENTDRGSVQRFRTMSQVADEARRTAAVAVINDAGWQSGRGPNRLTIDQLVAIARVCDPTFDGGT